MKGQFKHADRTGARATVIVGDELEVRDMDSGDQRSAADAAEVLRLVGA
jgi:histidyl-tRNA synthetase